jgi:hypothetical protein
MTTNSQEKAFRISHFTVRSKLHPHDFSILANFIKALFPWALENPISSCGLLSRLIERVCEKAGEKGYKQKGSWEKESVGWGSGGGARSIFPKHNFTFSLVQKIGNVRIAGPSSISSHKEKLAIMIPCLLGKISREGDGIVKDAVDACSEVAMWSEGIRETSPLSLLTKLAHGREWTGLDICGYEDQCQG